jgi:hypothetical protein
VFHKVGRLHLHGTVLQVKLNAGQIETKAAELSGDSKELIDFCYKYPR